MKKIKLCKEQLSLSNKIQHFKVFKQNRELNEQTDLASE